MPYEKVQKCPQCRVVDSDAHACNISTHAYLEILNFRDHLSLMACMPCYNCIISIASLKIYPSTTALYPIGILRYNITIYTIDYKL